LRNRVYPDFTGGNHAANHSVKREPMKSINQDFQPPFLFLITTALMSEAVVWLSAEIIFQLITKG